MQKLLSVLLKNEKLRFLVVGCANTLLDFTFLNLFTIVFGIFFVFSNIMSVIICITISFYLNHYFVFQKKDRPSTRSFLTFFAVTGFSSLALQSAIITSMHWLFGTPFSRSLLVIGTIPSHPVVELNLMKAVAVAVGMVWNFLFYKRVVFRDAPADTEAEFIG